MARDDLGKATGAFVLPELEAVLGQDEGAQGFAEIVAGHPDRTLAAWMEGQAKR